MASRPLIASAFTLALLTVSVGAQTVRLGDVMRRLDSYLQVYEQKLANVVAEEAYRQWVEQGPKSRRSTSSRMLRSDFALTLVPNGSRWVGYRDTFEMDGNPVRDRDERLQRLLSSGGVGQAAAIAEQNASGLTHRGADRPGDRRSTADHADLGAREGVGHRRLRPRPWHSGAGADPDVRALHHAQRRSRCRRRGLRQLPSVRDERPDHSLKFDRRWRRGPTSGESIRIERHSTISRRRGR